MNHFIPAGYIKYDRLRDRQPVEAILAANGDKINLITRIYEDGEVAFVLPDSGKEVPICAWRPLPFTARMALDERP